MKEGDQCPQDKWKCEGKLQYDTETKTLFCPICCWEEEILKKKAVKSKFW